MATNKAGKNKHEKRSQLGSVNTSVFTDSEDESVNETDKEWACNKCQCISRGAETPMLECDCCSAHLCLKCTKVTITSYKTLARDDVLWMCSAECTKIAKNNMSQLNKADNIASYLENKLTATFTDLAKVSNNNVMERLKIVEDQIKSQNDLIEQQRHQLHIQLKHVTEMPDQISKTWAHIAQNSAPKNIAAINNQTEQLSQIMKETFEEQCKNEKQQEDRDRSVILFRAGELVENNSNEANHGDDKEHDSKLVRDLINWVGANNHQELEIERLGRFDKTKASEGKCRPLRVRFQSRAAKTIVTNNLRKLKDAPPHLCNISVKDDLSNEERDILKAKLDEAKEKTKNSSTFAYLVRGPITKLFLKEVPKRQHQGDRESTREMVPPENQSQNASLSS